MRGLPHCGCKLEEERLLVHTHNSPSWGLPDRPGKPKRVVRVNWECLVEAPVHEVFNSHLQENFSHTPGEVRAMEYDWTMFRTSIADAASKTNCFMLFFTLL